MSLFKGHKTHWQWYKNFFGMTILRYLVTWFAIVPLIAKLFSQFAIKLGVEGKYIEFDGGLKLSFSLQLLWIASLLFVIALLLYQFFCPSFIKTYSSYGDYKKHLHSPRWIVYETFKILDNKKEVPKLFERLKEKEFITKVEIADFNKNNIKVEKNQTAAYFKYKSSIYRLAMPILDSKSNIDKDASSVAELEIFWEIFGRFSSSKTCLRGVIIILLGISGLLFLYTLAEHIYAGASAILFKM